VDDLPPGEVEIIDADGISVGVFNVDGEFYALHNRCPHQGAPLAEGQLTNLTTADGVGEYTQDREGEILRCPWHGWEFDVTTGRSVFNPHAVRTMSYDVEVECLCDDTSVDGAESGTETPAPKARTSDAEGVETYDTTLENGMVTVYV
jgi:nitrite reductase/ring-hydroxylating ferredoxin subunit